MNNETTLHEDGIHPVLRELESSLHDWELWVSVSRLDAIKALDIARSGQERTTDDTLLSVGFKELIYNQWIKVADILRFVQDEFIHPYDRLIKIIIKDYSSIFWENFVEELIEGLSELDEGNRTLQQIGVTVEWEEDPYILEVMERTYNGRSYEAITILIMLKTIISTNPDKKLLSITFSYNENSEST